MDLSAYANITQTFAEIEKYDFISENVKQKKSATNVKMIRAV